MLGSSFWVLDEHYGWRDDHNCWVFPKPAAFVTVVCRRPILRGASGPAGGQTVRYPRRVPRQPGLDAVRPRAPPTL